MDKSIEKYASAICEQALVYCENGNYAQGIPLVKEAASLGLPLAQFAIAGCYEMGSGVPRNISKAIEWYTKAAKQGFDEAQFRVGFILYNAGHIQDAFDWFCLSAKQGNSDAMYGLGIIYEINYNNLQEALIWYQAAADLENVGAQKKLTKLLGKVY